MYRKFMEASENRERLENEVYCQCPSPELKDSTMLHGDDGFHFCKACRKEYDNTKRNKDIKKDEKKDSKEVLDDVMNPYGSHYYGSVF